tara:strand:+ start:1217 stop:1639 length:423 start_codon:yes stop_codon:yes gene_type:complete
MDGKKFFSLLRQSNELAKNKNSLDAYNMPELLDFRVTIRNNYHFSERREYIDLAKDFLADQITADDFSSAFMGLYDGIEGEVAQMEEDESLELTNFLKTSQSELRDLLSQIYGTCDFFGHVIYDEKELRDCAQILLLKLQ